MLVLIGHVRAEPLPQPKVGQCPSRYRESEGYCAPLNDRAPAAVPKIGSCPFQDGRRAALTAPTLDGADVALQAREKHLHRGMTPLVFRPSTPASSPPMRHARLRSKARAWGFFATGVLDQQ
jgi:hypothetical protein